MSLDDLVHLARETVEAAKAEERRAAPRRRGRRAEPSIQDPSTHPRTHVSLRVAAEFLGFNERTVAARTNEGKLRAERDGRVWRIAVMDLADYVERRRVAS